MLFLITVLPYVSQQNKKGFITSEKGYELRKPLMAEGLEARLSIDLEGKLTGQVVDIDFDES